MWKQKREPWRCNSSLTARLGGAEIHSSGLTTRDARGRNESDCYFLLEATLPLLISAEQFAWTVALVHDWTECEFPPRLTATGGVETAARLFSYAIHHRVRRRAHAVSFAQMFACCWYSASV